MPDNLNALLEKWQRIVKDVENGYPLDTIDDYTNDLIVRDIIELVKRSTSTQIGSELALTLSPLDKRFEAATLERKNAVGSSTAKREAWWWFRVPKKCGKGLTKDLATEG